ncbi:acyltransferase, partial [bacterium]|nr:acyltransferase [bacterium]
MASIVSDIESTSPLRSSRYRPEIDGLRAFAVVLVIINHFNKDILPGGYLGVDIFFVISGYVITSSLFERSSKNFNDFISGFYERRIKRLVPALSVFVLIMSIAICMFNPSPGIVLRTGLSSLFGLSNLYLLKHSTDYFSQSTELNVFTHTWSLGVEEQFYILFPILIWFSGFGRQTKNGVRNLFLVVGILTIASLVGFLYLYSANQPAAYFLMPSRFWEMAAGCLIFIGLQKQQSVQIILQKVPPLLVLVLIVVAMYLPMSLAAVSTIAVVLLSSILIGSLKKKTGAFKFFTHPRVVYIGLISYSLYLWHWGVLSISRWTIGIHWWSIPIQVVVMVGLAIASYRWIETPFRKGNWFGKRWKNLSTGGIILIFSAITSWSLRNISFLKDNIYILSRFNLTSPHLVSSWWRDKTGKYIDYCHIEHGFNENYLSKCLPLLPSNDLNINYVVGDSHARNYVPAIRAAFMNSRMTMYLTNGQACLFSADNYSYSLADNPVSCEKQVFLTLKYILKNAKDGDYLFVGQSLLDDRVFKRINPAYFRGIGKIANSLKEKGVRVFLMDGTYPPLIPPEGCVLFSKKLGCTTPKEEVLSKYSDFDRLAAFYAAKYNFQYLPLRDGLCSGEICYQKS